MTRAKLCGSSTSSSSLGITAFARGGLGVGGPCDGNWRGSPRLAAPASCPVNASRKAVKAICGNLYDLVLEERLLGKAAGRQAPTGGMGMRGRSPGALVNPRAGKCLGKRPRKEEHKLEPEITRQIPIAKVSEKAWSSVLSQRRSTIVCCYSCIKVLEAKECLWNWI